MSRNFAQINRRIRDIQWYRRLRIRSYVIPEELSSASAIAVLAAFMKDDAYNTFFLSEEKVGLYDLPDATSDHVGDAPRHGPFMLEKLTVDNYRAMSLHETARRLMETLAEKEEENPGRGRGLGEALHYYPEALEEARLLLHTLDSDSTKAFVLDVDPQDEHYTNPEFAPHSEFEEYVLIDRARGQLHLIVVMAA